MLCGACGLASPHYGPLSEGYCPVAVTLQLTIKVTELLAGKVPIVSPVPKKLVAPVNTTVPSGSMLLGQDAPPVLAEQVTEVHCKPAEAASLISAPLAADGPPLLKVTV
jgi:hypothetical protein